ncbi:MAG TPA: hypothetical protein VF131_11120 [Blastocatellia bacterium]|nr:hypothetical protein [Blastocatellia bacterium]
MARYSNEIHKLLVSVSPHYYILNNGQLKYQKKKIETGLDDIGQSPKNHVVHYLLIDEYSGAFYAEVYPSRNMIPVEQFLYRAWAKKADHFFCGLPEINLIPKTIKPIVTAQLGPLFDTFGITPMHPSSGFDAGSRVIRTWENEITNFCFYPKPSFFRELQLRAIKICEEANNSLDKTVEWKRNLRKLILPLDHFYR